ncbi:MFS general substrate transporter [Didymella exigua CBS 183.55]|uniref:MFS general substrate transporter n=1 Tax=Didymella exigua CBS 183.55 TaxID=1150837 RepID=A0A6A5RGL6_9PLEO|nr:MFS general substrate transporter [Didymella exigua CBS 183.55]KAF1924767.1 MFS general substrate transporter [Didymella exigua CBS 183.55]
MNSPSRIPAQCSTAFACHTCRSHPNMLGAALTPSHSNVPQYGFAFSKRRKQLVLTTGLIIAFNSTLGSSLPSGAKSAILQDFNLDPSTSKFVLLNSLYQVGFAVSPLFFAPLSEHFGRRPLLAGSFTSYAIWTLCCAIAPSFTALVVFRLLAGLSAAVPNTVVAGLLADVYEGPVARGQAVAAFLFVAACGPLVGPLISGFTSVHLGWRWTFWVGLMIAGVGLPFVWCLPETYATVIAREVSEKSAADVPKATLRKHVSSLGITLKRPWLMMVSEPILLLTALYLALVYSMQYLFFQSNPIVYGGIYGLREDLVGLSYIPSMFRLPDTIVTLLTKTVLIGVACGSLIAHCFGVLYKRAEQQGQSWAKVSEYRRLPLACIGAPCIPIALLLLGFTADRSIPPVAPMILSGFFFGFGYILVFFAMILYLSDTYKRYAASAQAAASTTRSLVAVGLPFAASSLYQGLGVRWAGSTLAIASGVMAIIPFMFLLFRKKLKAESVFAG